MALVSQCKCEHPKIIYNKYLGKDVFVKCNKCVSCRRALQAAWISKLEREAKCHLFTYVIFLTYNEAFLPKYDFDSEGDGLVEVTPRLRKYYEKFPHLKRIKFNDLKFETDADYNYLVDRLNSHWTCMPHASVYDIQLFKKRLNTYIKREVTGEYGSFRSAIVSELGGESFRTHYHGILYFDDERIKAKLPELVARAWTDESGRSLGYTNVEPERGHAASYIAKYLCKSADLPSFYEHPALRNIFLTSRKPSLGSLFESSAEIREVFNSASPIRAEFKKQGDVWTAVPLPIGQNYENHLFPKCYAYNKISNFERVALYKLYGSDVSCFRSWCNKFFNRVFDFGNSSLLADLNTDPIDFFLYRYETNQVGLRDSSFARMLKSITYNFDKKRTIENFYTISKRVYLQAKILGVSLDYYINQIFKYHNYNKPQFVLRQFYNTQFKVLQDFPNYEKDYFYPLSSKIDPSLAPDAQVYFAYQRFKQKELLKNKYCHTYMENKLHFRDPILYNVLKKYFYAKKCNEALEALPELRA